MSKLTYKDAGLDLDVYELSLAAMAPLMRRTHTPRVLDGFGGFASLFSLDYNSRLFAKNYRHPVLVTCTDGVGSKLKVAGAVKKHDTVGIDLVAMSVNDCLCTGGEPLLFLDYLAMAKDDPVLTRDIIKGISDGCMEADCALVGGETAILPDFYQPGDYDLAGFCVGVVERDHIINGRCIQPGDTVLGLASRGLHSNGYSLVRKVVFARSAKSFSSQLASIFARSQTSCGIILSRNEWCAAWPISPAAAWLTTSQEFCRLAGASSCDARAGTFRRCFGGFNNSATSISPRWTGCSIRVLVSS